MHRTGNRALIIALTLVTGAAAPAMAQSMSNDKAMADKSMTNDKMMMDTKGTFTGSRDHKASGSFSITGSGKDRKLEFSDDFRADQAPDTYVVLAKGGMADSPGSLNLGKLKKDSGAQSYKIPEDANLAAYSGIVLWSKGHNMTVGQASLATGAMEHGAMGSMEKGAMMDKPAMAKDTGMMKKP